MFHYAEVGVHATEKSFLFLLRWSIFPRNFVLFFNCFVEIAFCTIGNINSVGLDYSPKVFYAFGVMLKIYFPGMKLQFEVVQEICFDDRNQGF